MNTNSIDINLFIILAIVVFIVWLLVVVWRYIAIQSARGITGQEDGFFGRHGRPEYREFMAVVIPRASSSRAFFAVLAIAILLGVAKLFGLL